MGATGNSCQSCGGISEHIISVVDIELVYGGGAARVSERIVEAINGQ